MSTEEKQVRAFGAASQIGQRKEMALQLRKTNFNLGVNHKGNNATYFDHYQEPPLGFQSSVMSQDFMNNIKNSHFQLGDPYSRAKAQSIAHTSFSGTQGGKQVISQETLQDLRRTHFTLGFDGQKGYESTACSTFKPKTADILNKEQRIARVIELRKHNFKFGSDPPSQTSIFKSDYGEKRAQTSNALQHLKKDLRNSHFQLGNDNINYESVAQATYQKVEGVVAAQNKKEVAGELRASHFKLGNDPAQYKSSQKVYFDAKKGEAASINLEKKQDLRKSHFELGSMPANYKSVFADSYTEPSQEAIQVPTRDSVTLRKTNFILGTDNNNQMYESLYKQTHHGNFGKGALQLGTVDSKILQKTNLSMGNDQPTTQSTSQMTFDKKPPTAAKLSVEQQQNLRSHHFKLGTDPNDFQTVSQKTLYKKSGPQALLSEETKADLRRSHFQLGYNPPQMISETTENFQNKAGQVDKPQHDSVGLRKTNFRMGNDKGIYSTTYQVNHNEKHHQYWNYN